MQNRHRFGIPAELDVALVACDDCVVLPRPLDDLAHVLDREHPSGRVGWRVEPHQPNSCLVSGAVELPSRVYVARQVVSRHRNGTGQASADVISRISELGKEDLVAWTKS